MRPIAPRIAGLNEEQIDGENYLVLPAATGVDDAGNPVIITRWRPSDDERTRLAAGEDVFLQVLGARIQPLQMCVGWPYGELER